MSVTEIVGAQSTSPGNLRYALLFLAGFDRCQIRQRPPALRRVLPNFQTSVSPPPCPSLALSGNRTDRPATGRLLRRPSGTRLSQAVRTIRGDRLCHPSQRFPMPCCFLPDLTRVKSGSARLPSGGRCRIYDHWDRPNRSCPSLALPSNRTDRPATGRSLRRSAGTRYSRSVRAARGDRPSGHGHPPPPTPPRPPEPDRAPPRAGRSALPATAAAAPPRRNLPDPANGDRRGVTRASPCRSPQTMRCRG